MSEIKELIQIVEDGGVIGILIAIIYYGQKQIDKLDNTIKNQLKELHGTYREMQKEMHDMMRDAIKIISKHNDIEPKINDIASCLRNFLFKIEKE